MKQTKKKPWPCIDCRCMMEKVDEDHCKCPICGTEVWYEYDKEDDDIEELMKDSIVNHQSTVFSNTMVGVKSVKGNNNNSKGKNKKSLLQKPSTNELYRRLLNS